jgi:outer membrane protein assembly factor BamB
VTADLSGLGGSRSGTLLTCILQEIDLASGQVLFEWHSADHVDPSESYASVPTSAGTPFDYFHINSVEVGPDGNLLISARNTWALYKLNRRSGAVIWRLAGKRSDFSLGTGVHFSFQHDARWHGSEDLTLFDDGAGPPNQEAQSRGLRLTVDEAARSVQLGQQFVHSPETLATSQGNLQQLDNGNVFIGWGSEPYATEHTASGRQVFAAQMATSQSYRAFRSPWNGTPSAAPAIAVRRTGSDNVVVYASWNGATEVASWQVIAGSGNGVMTPLVTAPRKGFETTIRARSSATTLAARALDRTGKLLAVSPSVSA